MFGKIGFELAPRITVLVGPSGAGKTQLLTAVHGCLTQGNDPTITAEVDTGKAEITCRFVDPAEESFIVLSHVRSVEGLEAKRDAVERSTLDQASLKQLGYLLGRDYERAAFAELGREDGVTGRWRYYELTHRGRTYGPANMSMGELVAFSIIMALKALRPGHVLLLDEPENFLSPRARARLADILIETAATKSKVVSLVVASHSAELVERFPSPYLRLLGRNPVAGITIEEISHTTPALERLGLRPKPKVLTVVEDVLASAMLAALLALTAPELSTVVRIVQVGGDGNVPKFVGPLQSCGFGLEVLGVLDGDSREKVANGTLQFPAGRVAFLPGQVPPDALLMNILSEASSEVAHHLGVEVDAVSRALVSAEGLDHHDRLAAVADAVGLPIGHVTQTIIRALANRDQERAQITELISVIRSLAHTDD
ncbi:ATP-dependent nuclease [Actinomadura violacea]|uniref:AAA family ATPase n=1 Tax=Actinomadura violacea TaxID=2819934 RepID=A0ABS3S7R3_9ACTN|nr:AAA family ATPase [Actinomadura violacea]MBO2465049.1 AAA family ATPase [Actinomadura violacea]